MPPRRSRTHDRYHHHGQRSGQSRRIEIVFTAGDDTLPERDPQDPRVVNLAAHPRFDSTSSTASSPTFPADGPVIVDPAERRRVLAVFVEEFTAGRPGQPMADGCPR